MNRGKFILATLFVVVVLVGSFFLGSGSFFQGRMGDNVGAGSQSSYSGCTQKGPVLVTKFGENMEFSGIHANIVAGKTQDVLQAVIDGCVVRVVFDGPNTLAFTCSYVVVTQKDGEQLLQCLESSDQNFDFTYVGGKNLHHTGVTLGLNPVNGTTWLGLGGDVQAYILSDFNKALFYLR